MYHRFHALHDCRVERVTYISGDTWNVNPIALRRIEKLFCKNERAVIETRLAVTNQLLTLVPVAAILVASIRLHCLHVPLNLGHRGPNVIRCTANYRKGDEMGWFEHGSTIVVLAPGDLVTVEQCPDRIDYSAGPSLDAPCIGGRARTGTRSPCEPQRVGPRRYCGSRCFTSSKVQSARLDHTAALK